MTFLNGAISRIVGGGLLAAGLVLAATACTAILNSGEDQCRTNGDCAAIGLAAYTCSPQRVCVKNPGLVAADEDGGTGCISHDKCTQDLGRPALCRTIGAACVPIGSEECKIEFEEDARSDWQDPNAIFIGNISIANGLQGLGANVNNQIIHAHHEIRTSIRGLNGGPNETKRPIVLVSCDASNDGEAEQPDRVRRIANHLVNNVRVPLVISAYDSHFFNAHPIVAAAQNETPKREILHYCQSCLLDARLAATQGDDGLVYQTIVPIERLAEPMAAKLVHLESEVRDDPAFPGGDIRVATFTYRTGDGAALLGLAEKVEAQLKFNGGKTVAENGANYKRFTYEDNIAPLPGAVDQMVAFQPHIILMAVGSARQGMPLTEARWPAGVMRPRYIGNNLHTSGTMIDFVQGNDELRRRFVGTAASPTPVQIAKVAAYQDQYKEFFRGVTTGQSAFYDVYWALIYAIAAAGPPQTGTLDGRDIIRGLARINDPAGERFSIGIPDSQNAVTVLSRGDTINLDGYVWKLDWDPATGKMPIPKATIFCVGRQTNGTAFISDTGQEFRFTTPVAPGGFEGNFSCP